MADNKKLYVGFHAKISGAILKQKNIPFPMASLDVQYGSANRNDR